MNKKGIMDDMFDFMFTVVAFFFIWFFVTVALVGGIKENSKLSLENTDEISANNALLNYLNTPIEPGSTMADLIMAAETDPEAQKKLEKLTNKLILDLNVPLFKGIVIKYPKNKLYKVIYPQSGVYSPYAEIDIKSLNGMIKISIRGQEKESASRARYVAATGFRTA